jgi:hypothetical protein
MGHAPAVSRRQRSRLYSEVNDRIYELLVSAEPDLPGEFLCECGYDCEQRAMLLPADFAELRRVGETVRSPDCSGSGFGLRGRRSRPDGGLAILS